MKISSAIVSIVFFHAWQIALADSPAANPNLPRPGLYKFDFADLTTDPGTRHNRQTVISKGKATSTIDGVPTPLPPEYVPNQTVCIAEQNLSANKPVMLPGQKNCKLKSYQISDKTVTINTLCEGVTAKIVSRRIGTDAYEQNWDMQFTSTPAAQGGSPAIANYLSGEAAEKAKSLSAASNSQMEALRQRMELAKLQAKDPATRQAWESSLNQMNHGGAKGTRWQGTVTYIRQGDCSAVANP